MRLAYPHDPDILPVSRFLLNYPFADRLFPRALEVIEHVKQWRPVALLTDGDVVFQPRKVDRSGLSDLADYPAADMSLDSIGDLLQYELAHLLNHAHLK